jgi:hypothetical protein
MTKPSEIRLAVWRAVFLVACLCGLVSLAVAQPAVNAHAAALQEFQTHLDAYLKLRSGLGGKLKPLSQTPSAVELAARQDALAAAMKAARVHAKQGDLVPPLVAELIVKTVREDFQRRNPSAKMGVFEEVPTVKGASLINKTYPADAALPTVPALLLQNLPRLPDNLQYRFVGRDVVILDGDLQVVIDYIARVLPPHKAVAH